MPDPIDTSSGPRSFNGFEWRFVFTTLESVTTTWAQGLLRDRQIALVRHEADVISAAVEPDDFRVNGIFTDGYPRIAQSNRLVYCFRREGGTPAWKVRAAGILMAPEDEGDEDGSVSHFNAYSPWKLLEARPASDAAGNLPGPPATPDGFHFTAAGSTIALDILKNTIDNEGTVRIDAGATHGGTSFYAGTIETTPTIVFDIQGGQSVADVWAGLVSTGNLDLVLTPIYDPVDRPGYTHELSIFNLVGSFRPNAVFAWDTLSRSAAKVTRMHDATPGNFFNKVQYHAGQGGPPVPLLGPLVNAASVAAFGSYWSMQFFPAQTSVDALGSAVYALAQQALVLVRQGRRTFTVEPIPQRAPVPLLGYKLGDRVVVHASERLRVRSDGKMRVEAIPIQIDDDGIERVGGLLLSPDWRGAP